MKNTLLVVLALVLAGCISTAAPIHVQHYTLAGTPAPHNTTTAPAANAPILRLAPVKAPAWINSTQIYYRLAYSNAAQINAYSRSAWVAPPPELLIAQLRGALAASGHWRAVLVPGDVAPADITLNIKLNNFAQVFSVNAQSVGVVDATATVLATDPRHVLSQRHFHVEQVASTPNAAGGVKALSGATRTLTQQLRDWLAQVVDAHAGHPVASDASLPAGTVATRPHTPQPLLL